MPVEIKKLWEGITDQKATDTRGNAWSVADLIARVNEENLPVMDIPLQHLCIDRSIGGMPMRTFVAHMKMVLECDLKHPIILDENGGIFDGGHRVAKALLENAETIKAVRLTEDPMPIIKGEN